ncbi:MAG: GNAT family N-acetyltransferase [Planctomycetota bacterium]|jgi:GNAT superfamily N-acetyltransferase
MTYSLRPIAGAGSPSHDAEVEIVASRMRETLMEVVDERHGAGMYTMDWLRARVRWHLDPANCMGEVLLAERVSEPEIDHEGQRIVGHTILRVEVEDPPVGLFSTFYVHPTVRREGVASALLTAGEDWFQGHGMTRFATFTAATNSKLHRLMEQHGYGIVLREGEMVKFLKQA